MPIDMHEYKFIKALEKLPKFEPDVRPKDHELWDVGFPAWRAPFTSLLLYCHSTGYRLPSYEDFFKICERTYKHKYHEGKFKRWFEQAELKERVTQRVKSWYESGMTEAYLYACLVDAFEDQLKEGAVFYDVRADWKLKADMVVVMRGRNFLIKGHWGELNARSVVEKRRDRVERERKRNTAASAHWDNREQERWLELHITQDETNCQNVNGVRLFSVENVNALIKSICDEVDVETFVFPLARSEREELYHSMIGSKS